MSKTNNNLCSDHAPKDRGGLPELVSQWFYKHGLFLSSYPTCASSIAIIAILISCYPLLNIPLPGAIPTKVILPYEEVEPESKRHSFEYNIRNYSLVQSLFKVDNATFDQPFPWAQSNPFLYVQQIIFRLGVFPWLSESLQTDAFRAPLYEVFKIMEIIRNHEDEENKTSLDQLCLHVDNVKRTPKNIFPEYNCLLLSPANLWGQDPQNFTKDINILNTIFRHHNLQKTKISVTEMVFGLSMQDTGFKRYPLRSRSRVIQYAVTLILKENNKKYLDSLKDRLTKLYPLHQNAQKLDGNSKAFVTYIYYPGEFHLMEFLPLCIAFFLLFIYVYFSVRKIDIIKSRLILALCAVLTVLGSLMMSLGICFFFGLTISLQSKGVFPYLVILVGLENCLVITKSVVSTDETFDIKIRMAQGLCKEGWYILKTLLSEITILTVGLATFVPVIQEFCVFAIVGLISDFFLQMLLFSTTLAMDIKLVDYAFEVKKMPKIMTYAINDAKVNPYNKYMDYVGIRRPFQRSHSHPKLSIEEVKKFHKMEITGQNGRPPMKGQKIPKRLRLVNFWVRTRFFQRGFMIWMSVWIISIVYNSEFLENIFVIDSNKTNQHTTSGANNIVSKKPKEIPIFNLPKSHLDSETFDESSNFTKQIRRLQYPNYEVSQYISNFHWPSILRQYNISLSGKYITILPPIKLSHAIKPEVAILLRNPKEQQIKCFQWKALAAALDPLDFSEEESRAPYIIPPGGMPLYPKSPMEIFLATILCAISVFVLTYTMVVFYRCICTRNYAEWRSSWSESEVVRNSEEISEGIPIQVDGHKHKIECLVSDGINVASSCLKGQIKLWDPKSGEMILQIDRTNNEYNENNSFEDLGINNQITKKQSPIWCLDYLDNLIAVGCADGRIEFWEAPTGCLKCTYQSDLSKSPGITHIHLYGNRVIVARLCGRLEVYKLETYYKGKQIDWGFTSAYRRTHARTKSAGNIALSHRDSEKNTTAKEEIKCTLEEVKVAHQQPIVCMEVTHGIIFTGSQDHTLKVFSLDDSSCDFTLHGHYGPITCLFVDHWQSGTGGSGSQDGLLCVWDLYTGACMYNIQAHNGSLTSLTCAPSYVISIGTDERVCVWERFQGNLLSTINVTNSYSSLLMLTPSLLVTSKPGSLMIWDVRSGEPTKEVRLDYNSTPSCPKRMLLTNSSVICDYNNQLRIVRFPTITDKCN